MLWRARKREPAPLDAIVAAEAAKEAAKINARGRIQATVFGAAISAAALIGVAWISQEKPIPCSSIQITEAWKSWERGQISQAERDQLTDHYLSVQLLRADVKMC